MSTEQQHVIVGGKFGAVQPAVSVGIETHPQLLRLQFCGKDSQRPSLLVNVQHGKLIVTLMHGGAVYRDGSLGQKPLHIMLSDDEQWQVME